MSYQTRFYGSLELPPQITHQYHQVKDLCKFVFPKSDMLYAHTDLQFFCSRAILSWKNDTVAELNTLILKNLSGEEHVFESVNQADCSRENSDNQGAHELPVEFLQSINILSLPPAQLRLKIGTLVMLMRNLHDRDELCNGTRLVITRLHKHCIEARILGGEFDGQPRVLFRALLTTNKGDFPFLLTQKHPIRVCFAMTVNKSQGQSLDLVGIDLKTSSFSHGQLYVALSRVTDVSRLALLIKKDEEEEKTENVVFPEVLLPNQQ